MSPPRQRRFSLTRNVATLWALPAFGLLMVGALWATLLAQLDTTKEGLLGTATQKTERSAESFERFARRGIGDADRMARIVKHEFEHTGDIDLPRLVSAGLVDDGGLITVSVADANGDVAARPDRNAAAINIADRDYFKLHATRDTTQLDISRPLVSRSTGRSVILLSRRLNHPDGSFAGIVLLAVAPEYFMEFYQEADLGTQGSIALVGTDGAVRARRLGSRATTAMELDGAELAARALKTPTGLFSGRSYADEVMQIVAYRKLPDYPFIVTAAQSRDEALADYTRDRRIYLWLAAIASLVIAIFFGVVTVLGFRLQRHRAELRRQRRFLETLFDNLPSGVTVRSMKPGDFGKYVLHSESNGLIFNSRTVDIIGRTVSEVMPADYAARIMQLDREMLASPMVQNVVHLRDLAGKGPRFFNLIRAPIFNADGRVDFILTSTTDITQERARTDELRLASKVFETTVDGIMLSDVDDRVIMVNAAFTRLTGFAPEDIVGKVLAQSPFRPRDPEAYAVRLDQMHRDGFVTGEVARIRKDGSPLSLWITASCVRNDDQTIVNYVRVFTDISLLKEAQRKLEQLASIDNLTGLPNRRLLNDRLDQAVRRAQRKRQGMAVMFLDLDGFKKVNDTLGHASGDQLLREVSARLEKCIRVSDSVGRIGGDEFAIILEDANLPSEAALVGERVVEALAAPFVIEGQRVVTAASIGIALYPVDATDGPTLLKRADTAMYRAKEAGRNRYCFYADAEVAAEVG